MKIPLSGTRKPAYDTNHNSISPRFERHKDENLAFRLTSGFLPGYPILRKTSKSRRFCKNHGDTNPEFTKNSESRRWKSRRSGKRDFGIFKSRFRIPGIGMRDLQKILSRSQLCIDIFIRKSILLIDFCGDEYNINLIN